MQACLSGRLLSSTIAASLVAPTCGWTDRTSMTLTSPTAQPMTPATRAAMLALLGAAAVGVAVAVAVVYANYNDPWRPLAHTFGLWAVMATAVAFRRPPRLAIAASITSLAAAVITFYIGLKVGHDIRWARAGSTMWINWDKMLLWLVLAVMAGTVFGLLGSFAARREWKGAAATAGLVGLVLADAYRRSVNWDGLDVAVAFDLMAALAVFTIASRYNRRPLLTLSFAVLAAVLGLLVVSTPDFIEQGLIEGF